MTYNAAFTKRVIRKDLIEKCGISRDDRINILQITDKQFNSILECGEINESLIIN